MVKQEREIYAVHEGWSDILTKDVETEFELASVRGWKTAIRQAAIGHEENTKLQGQLRKQFDDFDNMIRDVAHSAVERTISEERVSTVKEAITKRAAIAKLVEEAATLTDDDFEELSTAFRRAREAEFEEMIYDGKTPTVRRMNKWLASIAGQTCPSPMRVRIAKAIQHYRDKFNVTVYYHDEDAEELIPCTVGTQPMAATTKKTFRVFTQGKERRTLHSSIKIPPIVLEKE